MKGTLEARTVSSNDCGVEDRCEESAKFEENSHILIANNDRLRKPINRLCTQEERFKKEVLALKEENDGWSRLWEEKSR